MPTTSAVTQIDPRSPRFGAVITSVLLALIILLGPTSIPALVLLIIQTLAFAAGSLLGLGAQPWGIIYRRFVRPRLAPPTELEDAAPPRFAQTVGLVFALAGLLGWIVALPVLFYIAIAFALIAALLNAVFDFCLGCELYLLGKRILGPSTAS
ncbi:MAG TPA: DUF4395 domain-containing protein [Propioniciclava sp.]|jgi:hypothetical protein|uniref:DUF4395 domain-containing protein n=1 Tax=Propioniciclava sp. TaxID=2038686 RepID=UPI002CE0C3DC|nr:DUF4395 domain-containing protein [Propioniciclava sp.]HRL81510.1 DUF4395 domain-containing protein [Propioniciclava sp.]